MSEELKTREEQIIDEHKQAVIMTGNLSNFHIENLQKWPFIIFDEELESVSINYDFKNTDASLKYDSLESHISPGFVEYDLKLKKGVKVNNASQKLEALTAWVKSIFWQETEVKIKRNGRKWQVN